MQIEVDIEHVKSLVKEMKKINSVPIEEIVWKEKGNSIEIDQEVLKEWKFCGLTNIDFIATGFYREKMEEADGRKGI